MQEWLAAQNPEELAISEWTITEVSSALATKLRRGDIDVTVRASLLAEFNRLLTETFTFLTVTSPHFRTAAQFVDSYELGFFQAMLSNQLSCNTFEWRGQTSVGFGRILALHEE